MATYRLKVDTAELRKGLKGLKRFKKGMRDKSMILSYKGGNLALATPGVKVAVPAAGQWPRPVEAPAQLLVVLAKVPPEGDEPVVIEYDGKRLSIAGCSLGASLAETARPRVDVLPTKRLLDLLRMGAKWSREDLEKEGFLEQVWEAESKRDKLLDRAKDLLLRLGIHRRDMDELLQAKLRGQTTTRVKKPVTERNDLLAVAARILSPLNIDRADLEGLYNARRKPRTSGGSQNREA
ncbi:MAG: hypothetical protein R6X20_00350 [Phycisphaerae bacterium]